MRCILALAFVLACAATGTAAIDLTDTRLLTQPAVAKDMIAFVYANDLWIAGLDGKNPRRLTTDLGIETNPSFSPDGNFIAFTAQYDGNLDVYTTR